jgi:RsiW-degrading membrane proteinase PrsW (M82 family)
VQYRLTRFGIHSTALIVAIIYFILALVVIPFVYFASLNTPSGSIPGIAMLIGPVVYGIFGYVFTAIGCWLYNLVASWIGGIALTLEPDAPASA